MRTLFKDLHGCKIDHSLFDLNFINNVDVQVKHSNLK